MTELYWLVRKDLLRFFSDRHGATLTIFMPVILGMLLGLLFAPRSTNDLVQLVVIDEDKTPESRELSKALEAHNAISVEASDRDSARKLLETGDRRLALILPKGTGAKLTPMALFSGMKMDIPLWYDPTAAAEADIAIGLIMQVTMQQIGKMFADPSRLTESFDSLEKLISLDPQGSPTLRAFLRAGVRWSASADNAGNTNTLAEADPAAQTTADTMNSSTSNSGFSPPLALRKEAIVASKRPVKYNSYAHNFAGMLCMFILFWALDAAKELVIERDRGVETRVRLTPCPMAFVLLARAISTTLIGLLIALAVYIAAMGGFGVRIHGSWLGFILVILCTALSAAGFAILFAGIGSSERQIQNIGTFFVLISSFVGGAWFPSFLMPEWMQTIGYALPTFWATDGLAAMTWRGLPLSHAFLPCSVLIGMGGLATMIGIRSYRDA
ncbi:MAG: ABC transporter permease [Myxococcota bacterium]|nr:ABC transporter permease [Myxococcota bacterium]